MSTCPLCGGEGRAWDTMGDSFYGVTAHQAQLHECTSCSLLFHEPMPERSLVASFYPDGYWQEREGDRPGLMARLQLFYIDSLLRVDLMSWVSKVAPSSGSSWLDIGCSRGDWAALIAKQGLKVTGMEADPRAADHARRHFGLNVIEADDGSWLPEPDSFDTISFFHLLEHVLDPLAFLRKVHTALKPGGKILMRVPNRSSWQARIFGKAWKGWEQPRHLTMWNPECLRLALSEAGFAKVQLSTWALRDGPPCLSSSLFPSGEPTWQQIHKKPSALKTVVYLGVTWACTPLELLSVLFGAGSMITVIAEK